jgi:F-type H+-transporting ATPase subunit epsilon
MAMTIHVDIVSAEAALFSGTAEYVTVPAEMGEVGIYPRHTQMLTRIKPGSVRIKRPDIAEEEVIYVSGGMDYAKAQVELAEAVAQIAAIQKLRKRS